MERQGARDMVFCHQCENEWYRDEHGLTCPECHSDFTEIIEPQHDPRQLNDHDVLRDLDDHNPWAHTPADDAPDPDEDDIRGIQNSFRQGSSFHRTITRPGGGVSMTFEHTFPNTGRNAASPHANPQHDPVMQSFASLLGNIMGGGRPQDFPPNNPSSRPQSPQSPDAQPNVRVFTGGSGPFRYTATTRLYPRDANGPQPRAQTFDDLPNLLNHMFQAPPRGAGPDPTFSPMGPFGNLLAGLFDPANMQHGDAVYSQEALDRIISQLMEQNQSGNAPGPASADAIASLPKKTIAKQDVDETTGKADCSICMDEAPIGTQVTFLPCGHWFHGECIKAWLSEHDTCPHCRQGIMPKDGPENSSRPRDPGQAPRHDQMWGQAEGTRENPITLPESPPRQRPSSNASSSGGLFSRMRDAFGGGGGGSSSGNGGPSSGAA